jgi:hypothetical protein
MFILGLMLIAAGLFEVHSLVNWKYRERAYASITDYVVWTNNRGRDATLEQKGERLRQVSWGFLLMNQFEFLTMIVAAFVAFTVTLPYLLPIWILSFLPRRLKSYRAWRFFDNFACAALFFVAAMVVFVGTTANLRVG